MNKVACYPREYTPDRFDDDTWYFEMFSTPDVPLDNVGYVGVRILDELRRSQICPSTLAFDFLIIPINFYYRKIFCPMLFLP